MYFLGDMEVDLQELFILIMEDTTPVKYTESN